MARDGGVQLEGGDALHVGRWGFAGLYRLQPFSILRRVTHGIGQQQFVAHPQLGQQLAPARALRGG